MFSSDCRLVEMCARTVLRSSLTLRRKPKPIPHLSTLYSRRWRASVICWDLACLIWWEHEFTGVVCSKKRCHDLCIAHVGQFWWSYLSFLQQCKEYISQYGPLVFQQLMSMVSDFCIFFNVVFVSAFQRFHSSILHYQNGCLSSSSRGTPQWVLKGSSNF